MRNNKTIAAALAAAATLCLLLGATSAANLTQNTNSGATQNTNANGNRNSGMNANMNSGAHGNMNANRNTSSSGMGQNMNSNMGGRMMMSLSSQDRKFMMQAAEGGMGEVEMARVALGRASSDSVKRYAQQMIDDHTQANQELMQLAASKGVTLPAGPNARMQAMMSKMMKLSGADFDREYIKNAGVKDHEKMLKLLQEESRKGRDADVKAFAMKMIPAVEGHLRMAREMMGGMTGMRGNMPAGM